MLQEREVVHSGACVICPKGRVAPAGRTCWLYTREIPEGRFVSDRAKDQPSMREAAVDTYRQAEEEASQNCTYRHSYFRL